MPNGFRGQAAAVDNGLDSLNEQWRKLSAPADDAYADLADGVYDTVVEDARLTRTTSTGRPVVIWNLRITGPHSAGRSITKNRVITEKTLPYLKEDLEKCGIAVSNLKELPEKLQALAAQPISVEKRSREGHVNFYFRWRTRKTTEPMLDDDLPF